MRHSLTVFTTKQSTTSASLSRWIFYQDTLCSGGAHAHIHLDSMLSHRATFIKRWTRKHASMLAREILVESRKKALAFSIAHGHVVPSCVICGTACFASFEQTFAPPSSSSLLMSSSATRASPRLRFAGSQVPVFMRSGGGRLACGRVRTSSEIVTNPSSPSHCVYGG